MSNQLTLFDIEQLEIKHSEYITTWMWVWEQECRLSKEDEFYLNRKLESGELSSLRDIRHWINCRLLEMEREVKQKIKKLK